MKEGWTYRRIPTSRITTFDTFSAGLRKHHVSALLEFDVTDSRRKLRDLRKRGFNISFNGWLVKVIGSTLKEHPDASAYLYSKRKLMIFNDINISMLVEKKINGKLVPIPVVIEKTNLKSAEVITAEIENAKDTDLEGTDLVINRNTSLYERLYYHMPGFLRRYIWRILLGSPGIAFRKMGNAVITSVGMMGKVNGWFIHRSVHPISFGVGSVIKKPVVVGDEIKIREILNMTILIDHDVIDGAPMVRLLNDLTRQIESGEFIA